MKTSASRGMSLLELSVSAALLTGVTLLALSTFGGAERSVTDSMIRAELMLRANRLERELNRELRGATNVVPRVDTGYASPDGPCSAGTMTSVLYDPITGWHDGAATTGSQREIRFRYDSGEGGGGNEGTNVDDDRDGLIDDGHLELVDGSLTLMLAQNVSSDDFSIVKTGNRVTVRYTLMARVSYDPTNPARGLVTESRELVLALRNP